MALSRTLVRTVAEELAVEEGDVEEGARFAEDLNADSLDLVELTMAIEERFGITIEDDEAAAMKTVGDVQRWLEANAPNAMADADAGR